MANDYPDITVVITTFDRVEILRRVLLSLNENLLYQGRMKIVIGNDGPVEPLTEMLNALPFTADIAVVGDGTRRGLGANTNAALRACQTEIVLQTQDDYLLTKPLDLTPHVLKLLSDPTAGWIRLRLLNGQDFTATIDGNYGRVWWHSQSQYIASDQPHLKRWREWHDHYGYYPESVSCVLTENGFSSRCKEVGQGSDRKLDVLIPNNWTPDEAWPHLGEGDLSWAAKGY